MTITPMELYWITRLDNIYFFMGVLVVIFTIATIVLGICLGMANIDDDFEDKRKIIRKPFYIILPITIVMMFVGCFIPSTKEMAAIIIVPKVVNSDFVQTKLPKEADILYELTKAWLTEKTTPEKK